MSAFLWPPSVIENEDAAPQSYGYAGTNTDSSIAAVLPAVAFSGSTYYTFGYDVFINNEQLRSHVTLTPSSGALSSGGSTVSGTTASGTTTSDGVGLAGGYANCGHDFSHWRAPDFDNTVWCWGSSYTTGLSGVVGVLSFGGSKYANNSGMLLHAAKGAYRGSGTEYYCFFIDTVNEGSSMNPVFVEYTRYFKFTTGANTFSAMQSLFGSGDALWYMLDAGEGYYYALVKDSASALVIYGVDFSSGTPVVTSALATLGLGQPGRPGTPRYVTLNGNRVVAFTAGTGSVVITYTAATKNTPTINTYGGSGGYYTVEYDPADTTKAYLVSYGFSGISTVDVVGSYLDLANPGAGFSGGSIIASLTHTDSPNVQRERGVAGAMNGETTRTVAIAQNFVNFGAISTVSAVFQFWHTPVEFTPGVNVGSTASVAAGTPEVFRQRGVDITSGYSSVSAGVALNGAHSDDFQWTLSSSSVITSGVNISSTYKSVSLEGDIITLVECEPLTQYWLNTGYTFMDDFMVYVNQDRAAVGLPPYKTFGVDGQFLTRIDIANYHANQCAWLDIFAHDSINFWPGWRTFVERADRCPATGGAENVQVWPVYQLTTEFDNQYPSAFELWENWHNSPGHYANMVRNWGEDNDKAYSMLGIAEGWYPIEGANQPSYAEWTWVYAVNNFVVLETQMFETTLQQFWDNSGALVSILNQRWANDSWTPVSAQLTAPYSLRVAAQLEAQWGCRAAAQCVFPFTFSASRWMEFPYTQTGPVTPAQMEFDYAIKNTTTVVQENEIGYAIRVSGSNEAMYSLLVPVAVQGEFEYAIKNTTPVAVWQELNYGIHVAASREFPHALLEKASAQLEAPYAVKNTTPVAEQHESPYSMRVAAQSESPYSLYASAAAQLEAPYGDVVVVRTQQQQEYALLASNPVAVSFASYYSLVDYVSTLVANNTVKLILADGSIVVVDDGVIESSESDVGYNFECAIADLAVYSRINEDDPIVVDFCGELYDFFVITKSMNRGGPVGLGFRLSATNAVVRTGQPYAQETDYIQDADMLASDLIDALVEINFNFEIVDWTILGGRLQVAGATTLEAVQQIAEATGGVVDGTPDGVMRIRYPYPVPMNALDAASIDQSYSDDYDNLSVTVETRYRDGANRFRIREGEASYADVLEWVPDEVQTSPVYQTGIVKAYLSPYRTTASIVHLGNAVTVTSLGEKTEYHEELVEFNEGVGNTQRPIHQLLSLEWYTADMGTPVVTPYSTSLTVGLGVNNGYGLAKVTYNAKHLTVAAAGVPAYVESGKVGPASAYGYFILEEANG